MLLIIMNDNYFDNDIKSVEVEEKSIGGFRNGTNKMS